MFATALGKLIAEISNFAGEYGYNPAQVRDQIFDPVQGNRPGDTQLTPEAVKQLLNRSANLLHKLANEPLNDK